MWLQLEHVSGSAHTPLSKGDLVTMAMENEKRVGVNSGGCVLPIKFTQTQFCLTANRMDQAASVMSNPSSALYISFFPTLSASPVPLPTRATFIISNSLVVSDKALTAKHRYNLRVVETLVGARILANHLGVKLLDDKEKVTYREVLGRVVGEPQGCGGEMGMEALIVGLKTVLGKIKCLLPKGVNNLRQGEEEKEGQQLGVTMEEMIEMSGLSPKAFHEVYLSWVDGTSQNLRRLFITLTRHNYQLKRSISNYINEPNMSSLKLYAFCNSAG